MSLYRQSGSKQLKTALKLASSGNVAELLSFLQVVLVLDVDDDDLAPQWQMCLSFSGSCRLLIAMAAKCSFYICYQLVINIYDMIRICQQLPFPGNFLLSQPRGLTSRKNPPLQPRAPCILSTDPGQTRAVKVFCLILKNLFFFFNF